jgi:hypothetical protein
MENMPETPEEMARLIAESLREVHLIDNQDGTATMTFVLGDEKFELTSVIEVHLPEWFGGLLTTFAGPIEEATSGLNVTAIPNTVV